MSGFPSNHSLHSGYSHSLLRTWQNQCGNVTKKQLMYPVFVTDALHSSTPISALPEQSQFSIPALIDFLKPLVEKGLESILLFGVLTKNDLKDERGSVATNKELSPVILALPVIKQNFPNLLIATDVCLCAYTNHGHCGVLTKSSDQSVNLDVIQSAERIAELALAFAEAGAHIVAPSDMMDCRIGAIKRKLEQVNLHSRVAVMSYSAKFASCMYGPFRHAANSAPSFGDRRCYQLPSMSKGLAIRATERDIEEGADIVMVKPAMTYMDILYQLRQLTLAPIACYHVSGEYAMLWFAAQNGSFDLKTAVLEVTNGLRRAGADIIITYFTPKLLDWL
eukprot:TRINITY_DN6381_c1_g1_i1.p1 TRINITY_DN6381_c1_g1~~TRINITY_DN6381_c1_g1_i1.p1  ORF type:complete len:336 (-),score=172.66 TRINITY_DN6381_c1_g1_i1:67-1074(-)